jgi:beta-1,4-mannooligosaccharide/beta-1,4-mannosyl-N-acetylglucosamine phosphorylase
MTIEYLQEHVHKKLDPVREWKSPPWLRRDPANPILSSTDVPYDSHLVFNCSVLKEERYRIVFRNDYYSNPGRKGPVETCFGYGESDDGISWEIAPEPVMNVKGDYVKRLYDPRVTPIEGTYYLTACANTPDGPRAVLYSSPDLHEYTYMDMSLPQSRNTLLFPEKIDGYYYRLERPMWSAIDSLYVKRANAWVGHHFDIWVSRSPDLIHWGAARNLVRTEDIPYANIKIGPGAPPIRTKKGWLLLIHGVDFDPSRGKNGWEPHWRCRYHAGVALADLEEPWKLIGLGRSPLITPEAEYEISGGYRNNVVFPMSGIVQENGEVSIYYGAADTTICLATAKLDELLEMCEPV